MESLTQLTDAIKSGDRAAAETLLDRDPALVHARGEGASPIMLAIYHGKGDLARLLVDRGAVLTFHEACALGDQTRVEALLDSDPDLASSFSPDGFPALALSVFFGHGELARLLLSRGADVDAAAQNDQKVTALHAATARSDSAMVRTLIEHGAGVNARQQLELTPLHSAASAGDLESARLLIAGGADRTVKSTDGKTPADLAREKGHEAVVSLLETA